MVYNVESLSPGGFNRQHALEGVAHIYRTMGNVIALAKEQNIPTYRAADTLVEQRIALVRKVKSLVV